VASLTVQPYDAEDTTDKKDTDFRVFLTFLSGSFVYVQIAVTETLLSDNDFRNERLKHALHETQSTVAMLDAILQIPCHN
jgi:hypothetical protein